jgi:hypothetical protein
LKNPTSGHVEVNLLGIDIHAIHSPWGQTIAIGIPLGRSGFLHPNFGNPDGATSVSAGGLMWNGRSASEWGGG